MFSALIRREHSLDFIAFGKIGGANMDIQVRISRGQFVAQFLQPSRRRATEDERARAPASCRANSRPIPDDAPVISACSRRGPCAQLTQDRLEHAPDHIRDDPMTGRVWVNRDPPDSNRDAADAFEQKRNQRRVILLRELAETALKFAA